MLFVDVVCLLMLFVDVVDVEDLWTAPTIICLLMLFVCCLFADCWLLIVDELGTAAGRADLWQLFADCC